MQATPGLIIFGLRNQRFLSNLAWALRDRRRFQQAEISSLGVFQKSIFVFDKDRQFTMNAFGKQTVLEY